MPKLYVIAGHGAGDSGASGNGYQEATVARQIASRLKALGGDNVTVLDTSVNWYAAGRVNADLKKQVDNNPVLEIHLDSAAAYAKGGHVIIKEGYTPDQYDNALAAFIKSYFPGRSSAIVGRSNLANVNRSATHGINYRLLECCFITNSADMQKLMGDMDAFCKGVLNAFGIASGAQAHTQGWVKDSKGWWWRNADGTYPKSAWKKVNGKWYWFDAKGYAVHDTVLNINGKWYAFDNTCAMKTAITVSSNGNLVL